MFKTIKEKKLENNYFEEEKMLEKLKNMLLITVSASILVFSPVNLQARGHGHFHSYHNTHTNTHKTTQKTELNKKEPGFFTKVYNKLYYFIHPHSHHNNEINETKNDNNNKISQKKQTNIKNSF